MPDHTRPVVAICNTLQAMCDVVSLILDAEGWHPVTANLTVLQHDVDAICAVLAQHQPHAVIFDIAPPYDHHWQVFLQVRARSALTPTAFIPTSTNTRQLEELVGRTATLHVISKPFALERLVQAVRQALATTLAAPHGRTPRLSEGTPHGSARARGSDQPGRDAGHGEG